VGGVSPAISASYAAISSRPMRNRHLEPKDRANMHRGARPLGCDEHDQAEAVVRMELKKNVTEAGARIVALYEAWGKPDEAQ
jgi:hypothetical protein